ncbi:MAG TPA: hypothetical protein VN418_07865 [Gammaproteobacteria bacterium]|nr:hypothetical protein [Gammaproteobacteria bacterium]
MNRLTLAEQGMKCGGCIACVTMESRWATTSAVMVAINVCLLKGDGRHP